MKVKDPCNGCAHRLVCRNAEQMKKAVEAFNNLEVLQELGDSIRIVQISCRYYFPACPTIREPLKWDDAAIATLTENYGDSH